jgi:hypothetical protein
MLSIRHSAVKLNLNDEVVKMTRSGLITEPKGRTRREVQEKRKGEAKREAEGRSEALQSEPTMTYFM